MFDIATLKTTLATAIGFKNTEDPDLPDCTVTTSDTGMYYNDYHPLITYDNIYAIAPNFDAGNYNAWSATAHSTGDIAIYDSIAYKATRTITATGGNPTVLTAWESPVNDWIEQKINASISTLGNKVQTYKKVAKASKTFLQTTQLIDGPGNVNDTVTKSSRFVGFEITPKYTNNIKAIIDYIGFQFTEAQTSLSLYLYHSSQYAPITTFTVTTSSSFSFDWQKASTITTGSYSMPYVDYERNLDSGGSFYLGYFEDDIAGSAIEKDDFSSCYKSVNYNMLSKWLDVRPIVVSSLNGTNIFNIDDVGYVDSNLGLNLSLSVHSDVTELLISNKSLFTNALGNQFAIDMLNEMLHNPNSRINRSQENATRNKVLYELTEDQNSYNLNRKLDDSLKALDFDLSNISQVLPKRKPGITSRWA